MEGGLGGPPRPPVLPHIQPLGWQAGSDNRTDKTNGLPRSGTAPRLGAGWRYSQNSRPKPLTEASPPGDGSVERVCSRQCSFLMSSNSSSSSVRLSLLVSGLQDRVQAAQRARASQAVLGCRWGGRAGWPAVLSVCRVQIAQGPCPWLVLAKNLLVVPWLAVVLLTHFYRCQNCQV